MIEIIIPIHLWSAFIAEAQYRKLSINYRAHPGGMEILSHYGAAIEIEEMVKREYNRTLRGK